MIPQVVVGFTSLGAKNRHTTTRELCTSRLTNSHTTGKNLILPALNIFLSNFFDGKATKQIKRDTALKQNNWLKEGLMTFFES